MGADEKSAVPALRTRLLEMNTNSAAVFGDKFYSCRLKCNDDATDIIVDGHMSASFKISDRLPRHVRCFCKLRLAPA